MMRFTIDGSILKSLCDIASAVSISDLHITFHGVSAKVKAVDPSHCAIINADFAIEDGPVEPIETIIPTVRLKEVIVSFAGEERVNIDIGGSRMSISVGRKRRIIGLIDPRNSPNIGMPDLEHALSVSVPKDFLRSCLKASPGKSLVANIEVRDGVFSYTASEESEVFEDSMPVSVTPEGASAKSMFTTSFIADVLDPATSKEVRVHLSDNYPLKLEYAVRGGNATVLLAPRLIDEGSA
jgi:DNA polymerase III sliding clamp (beta) subunit (PCNA family)